MDQNFAYRIESNSVRYSVDLGDERVGLHYLSLRQRTVRMIVRLAAAPALALTETKRQSDAECGEPPMASRQLPRGHAVTGKLDYGYATGARSRTRPDPRQSKVAFRRPLHAGAHESRRKLCKGGWHRRGHARRRCWRSGSLQSSRLENWRYCRIHELRLAGMVGLDARHIRPRGREQDRSQTRPD